MEQNFDAVTLGELMLRLSPSGGKRLCEAGTLEKCAAGAELNVAAGLAQLGLRTAVCSKLPDNALARFVCSQARAAGVSDEGIVTDPRPGARMGVYYYENASSPRRPAVVYDRAGSSIHSLTPDEVPASLFSARLFHVSGITLGIGPGPRETALRLIDRFKTAGAMISFDVNYRANLWGDQEERAVVEPLLPLFDVLFVSEESLRRMFGRTGERREMVRAFAREYGVRRLFSTERHVLSPTRHTFASLGYDAGTDTFFTESPYTIDIVDRIGSGDAYVAGALYGLLKEDSLQSAVRCGDAMAAAKCTVHGDLPCIDAAELARLIEAHADTGVQDEMTR